MTWSARSRLGRGCPSQLAAPLPCTTWCVCAGSTNPQSDPLSLISKPGSCKWSWQCFIAVCNKQKLGVGAGGGGDCLFGGGGCWYSQVKLTETVLWVLVIVVAIMVVVAAVSSNFPYQSQGRQFRPGLRTVYWPAVHCKLEVSAVFVKCILELGYLRVASVPCHCSFPLLCMSHHHFKFVCLCCRQNTC